MATGCGDVLSLEDLKTAKLHQLFEAEVITGRQGGVPTGAEIEYATNQVTGQSQKTLPAILRDLGYIPASFDFATGGTLSATDRNKAVLWPLSAGGDGDYYYWEGALPKIIPAGSTPAGSGGVADGAWRPVGDIKLRNDLTSPTGPAFVSDRKVAMNAGGRLSDVIAYVTAEQFGAVGNGSTNDTAAIQAAIDYVYASGGGQVRLAAKVYRAAGLVLKPMVRLTGVDQFSTTIKAPDSWNALAVVSSIDFQLYSTGSGSSLTAQGSYGATVEDLYIHGNYDSFSGTPSKFSGLGLAMAGICTASSVDIGYAPSTGYVHLNFEGSPNSPPSYWPANKGLKAASVNGNISVKWCGNDCAYIENADSVYGEVLFGFPAKGVGTPVASFWDTTRGCCGVNFASATYVEKLHAYAYSGGIGVIFGHGDLNRGYTTYRYGTLVCETLCTALWVRANAKVDGIKADFHNISMNLTLAEFGTTYGNYAPGCLIQSGQFISGVQASRQQSDFGKITFWNFTVSGSQPSVGFMGTHIVLAGENNTVDVDLHRSRFLDPALGGLGLMLAGINNHVRGRITGFLANDSSGASSAAIQIQPGSVTNVDLDVNRCNIGLRWSTSSSVPILTGRINITDNVTTYTAFYEGATLLQRGSLRIDTPGGSNQQSALSAPGSVSVTASGLQTVTVTGLNLPYVPLPGEVKAWTLNDLTTPQTAYAPEKLVQYVQSESSRSTLSFRVQMEVVSGAAAGNRLAVKLN